MSRIVLFCEDSAVVQRTSWVAPHKITWLPCRLCPHWVKSSRHPAEFAANPPVIRRLRIRNQYQRG